MDVAMTRKDYIRAKEIFPNILNKYGIIAEERINEPLRRICISYNHGKTGIWLDVFPVDECYIEGNSFEDKFKKFEQLAKKYREFYLNNYKKLSIDRLELMREHIFHQNFEANILFRGLEFSYKLNRVFDKNTIFPLTTYDFEGKLFPVPHNYLQYLKQYYGDYMSFPRIGINNHIVNNISLANRSKLHDIDMNIENQNLSLVLNKIISERC
jgi:phosphorylcholine metabolism protein LicD